LLLLALLLAAAKQGLNLLNNCVDCPFDDFYTGDTLCERVCDWLDHGHSGEFLLDLIDCEHVFLVELSRLLDRALLNVELLLEILLKISLELRWADLIPSGLL